MYSNGGPGCSGLLGALTEQGPFRTDQKDMTLSLNPYAWNNIANMVFIEAPVGVGFSYSDEPDGDDYTMGDEETAQDNYEMIQGFLTRFPHLKTNSLYITSESYGGHYMPTLAKEIVDRNTAGKDELLNFKGFFLGNPATTIKSTIPAMLETYWGHQLVPKPTWDAFKEQCQTIKDLETCEMFYFKMYREVGNLNPYALDYPVCLEDEVNGVKRANGRGQRSFLINNFLDALAEQHKADGTSQEHLTALRKGLGLEPVSSYEPCTETYLTTWINQQSVKEALHVTADTKGDWADCSRSIRYKQSDGMKSMTPYYNYLIDGKFGLNMVVFSGDDDDVCATVGTQGWIWDLGYEVAGQAWQEWIVDGQTAGYLTKWADTGFAFATVRGAGHEVPAYKPKEALQLWQSYLNGELTNA